MAKRKGVPVSEEMGEAEALEEAADKKLSAAKKLSQADAILKSRNDPDDDSSFDPVPYDDNNEPYPQLGAHLPPEPEPREPSRLEQVIEELRGQGKVEVYKVIGGAKAKIGVYPIEDYPEVMEGIAREHNGGTFKVIIKDARGNYKGSDTQTYDPLAYGKSSTKKDGDSAMMERMLDMMEKKEQSYQLQLEQLRREQSALMLEIVRGGSKGSTAAEVMSLLKASKELAGGSNPLESVKDILEVVAMLNSNGVGEPASPLTTAIDRAFQLAAPLLGAWAAKMSTASPASSTGALPLPALEPPRAQVTQSLPAPTPSTPSAPAPTPAPEPKLKGYAQSLLAAAGAGQSPDGVAEAILSMVPDDDLDDLDSMVSDPGFVGSMLAVEPALIKHQAWLANLCKAIKERLVLEEEQVASGTGDSLRVSPVIDSTPVPVNGGGK